MTGELGKASLDLEVNLQPFRKNMREGKSDAESMQRGLDSLAAISKVTEEALRQVKMSRGQAAESKTSAAEILSGVRGVSDEAREAARHLDEVKLDTANAVETTASGDLIERALKDITGEANEARRALESVRLAGVGARGAGPGGRNPGVGIGPFGSGFGRIGVLGAAIGAGTLLGPAAGPGALGAVLAATTATAPAAVGALGTLALAFAGVGKAIGGDKRAYDELVPAQQQFVLTVRSLNGALEKLKQTAAANLFPGLTDALHSALSPGTLSAVTTAVAEFGRTIGLAGAAWGRYFGSAEFQSIFIPLMHAGAHEVTLMSAAFLSLFDALGVVLRAATPLTTWFTKAIADGARFADSWLHAKDATGSLGRALDEMKVSMQLIGGLFTSLVRVVGALGEALYPVSKIAVKDLTDGLNALAGIIRRNQEGIREFVGAALSVLVSLVKAAVPVVTDLANALKAVVGAVGGWRHAFELIIGGMLVVKIAGIVTGVAAVGAAAATAEGAVAGLRVALLGIGAPEVLAALAAAYGLYKLFTLPSSDSRGAANQYRVNGGKYQRLVAGGRGGVAQWVDVSQSEYEAATGKTITQGPGSAHTGTGQTGGLVRGVTGPITSGLQALEGLLGAHVNDDYARSGHADNSYHYKGEAADLAVDSSVWARLFANRGAFAELFGPWGLYHNGVKFYDAKLQQQHMDHIHVAYTGGPDAITKMLTSGGTTTPAFGDTPAWTSNTGSTPKPAPPTGANLLSERLRNALQSAKDKALTTTGSTAEHWLQAELNDLEKAKKELNAQLDGSTGKKRAAIQQEIRSIDGQIASVNKQITTNLRQQAQAVKQAFAPKIAAAKSNIMAAFQTLKAALDAQFQAATQDYVDSVLGPRFFQGSQTPLEKQLADMQAADTLKQLQDAIKAAGSPEELAAAQRQLDEYQLGIRASEERTQADRDYATAVKKYQAERSELERQMNLQLDTFSKGLADGTVNLTDLAAVASEFGVSLTADGGIVDDFAVLGSAVQDLATVFINEAQKFGATGGSVADRLSTEAALRAARLLIPSDAPGTIPGTSIGFPGFVAAALARNQIPKLDVGGQVLETGLAVVHRGETFSGVGRPLSGGDVHVHLDGPAFVGNEAELAMQIGRALQKANLGGVKFNLA